MEFLTFPVLDKLTTVAVLAIVALSVITDKLVWHTRLKLAQERADRWERVAIEALAAGAKAGVEAAEITAAVVSAMPDPERNQSEVRN